jgi:hypothetical protein
MAKNVDKLMLEKLQSDSFNYFLTHSSSHTGLVADSTKSGSKASIAATGMALTAYTVAVERALLSRQDATEKVLKVLRFFIKSTQSKAANATGYKGFYYHFLDMKTGKRASKSELSTIDTSLFLAGVITAGQYFSSATAIEREIRDLAEKIYLRVDWKWALNRGKTISRAWKPECGFLPGRWDTAFSEAIFMYVLALGSPTKPIKPKSYREWIKTFEFRKFYNFEYIFAAPLFIHQFSQMWIDFRGIRDHVNKKHNLDYFENSKRATLAQQAYAISNPLSYDYYSRVCWGFTASNGPGEKSLEVDGIKRHFHGYLARGAPEGIDDGTVSPWSAVASLPFAPEIVIDSVRHFTERLKLNQGGHDGLEASFNFCYPGKKKYSRDWVSPWRYGINEGPVLVMIENYFSELIWKVFCKSPHVIKGLKAARFKGGWLEKS